MEKSIMRALVRGIIHAENNMTMPEYIQDVKDEIREEAENGESEAAIHELRRQSA